MYYWIRSTNSMSIFDDSVNALSDAVRSSLQTQSVITIYRVPNPGQTVWIVYVVSSPVPPRKQCELLNIMVPSKK